MMGPVSQRGVEGIHLRWTTQPPPLSRKPLQMSVMSVSTVMVGRKWLTYRIFLVTMNMTMA